ncbi:MAG TPA: divalent-cation tolerance protein CutA [Acidobacteriaceae bacterium]
MILPAAEARLVLTTAGSRDEAERIAHALVEQRVAACVNLLPGLTSIYRWHGAIESAGEILLLIKTAAQHLDALEATLRDLHSYDVPELLVLAPESASHPYLAWLVSSTRPEP